MALADELNKLRATKPRTFEAWCDIADPEDRQLALDAINDRNLPYNALALTLRKAGIPITPAKIVSLRDSRN